MPRYLSVESEPVSVCCYTCGAGFGFFDYEKLPDSRCAQCSTPLFLPHELEGVGHKTKRIS
jgi:DNA-directed RNA polymerase subunit RPC12/RpoP